MGCTSEQSNCQNDEKPTHQVTLTQDYYMGKYEVTWAQWRKVMGSNPSNLKNCDNCPVENVSWNSMQNFITKLNAELLKKNPAQWRRYRLPTEAEWEYAARGGNKSKGYKYVGSNTIGEVAWYYTNTKIPRPVGGKKANELGLYDMSGNVGEWCSDWKRDYKSTSVTNPKGPAKGTKRVVRGGSWVNGQSLFFRVSFRGAADPAKTKFIGFRLCLTL